MAIESQNPNHLKILAAILEAQGFDVFMVETPMFEYKGKMFTVEVLNSIRQISDLEINARSPWIKDEIFKEQIIEIVNFLTDHSDGKHIALYDFKQHSSLMPNSLGHSRSFNLRWSNLGYIPSIYAIMCKRLKDVKSC